MKNFRLYFHGAFTPPLVVPSASFQEDSDENDVEEFVTLNGFYAARQARSDSPRAAMDEWIARISQDNKLQLQYNSLEFRVGIGKY